MLEKLGIYGMEEVESAVLAGLVTGDPLLLVGSHGSGKTLLCERLARALGLKFWPYDASKAMFEDVLGFPTPGSLAQGRVDYVPTSISIWGKEFVLVDELSRANPSMQNKWLEVIRSRQVMGKKIDGLKHIVAAMNPPSYLGAHPLDAALAGRFAFIIPVPEAQEMGEDALTRIVEQISEDDAPLLGEAAMNSFSGAGISEFIAAGRARMEAQPEADRRRLTEYVLAVNQFLAGRELAQDGRRLGMIQRSLRAYLAVEGEKSGETPPLAEHEEAVGKCLSFTLPFAALGETMMEPAVKAAHFHALPTLSGNQPRTVMVLPREPARAAALFIRRSPELAPDEKKAALTSFISRAKSRQDLEQKAHALLAVIELAETLCRGGLTLAPDDQHRLLSFYQYMTMIDANADSDEIEGAFQILDRVMDMEMETDLGEPVAFLGFRLGCQLTEPGSGRRSWRRRNDNEAARMAEEIYRALGGRRNQS